MRVSEKSLELNVGAELLTYLRDSLGMQKAYLRGLTQQEERREGVDFFVQLDPATRILAFQFKAPKGRLETTPYRYTLVDYQHSPLYALAQHSPKSVYYVFPFFVTPQKLQAHVPHLMSDTWLLDIQNMHPANIFGNHKTRTIRCQQGSAKVNPEFAMDRISSSRRSPVRVSGELNEQLSVPSGENPQYDDRSPLIGGGAISPSHFGEWYLEFRKQTNEKGRRSSWLSRGLRVVIIPP